MFHNIMTHSINIIHIIRGRKCTKTFQKVHKLIVFRTMCSNESFQSIRFTNGYLDFAIKFKVLKLKNKQNNIKHHCFVKVLKKAKIMFRTKCIVVVKYIWESLKQCDRTQQYQEYTLRLNNTQYWVIRSNSPRPGR